jgi:hypothetical protein
VRRIGFGPTDEDEQPVVRRYYFEMRLVLTDGTVPRVPPGSYDPLEDKLVAALSSMEFETPTGSVRLDFDYRYDTATREALRRVIRLRDLFNAYVLAPIADSPVGPVVLPRRTRDLRRLDTMLATLQPPPGLLALADQAMAAHDEIERLDREAAREAELEVWIANLPRGLRLKLLTLHRWWCLHGQFSAPVRAVWPSRRRTHREMKQFHRDNPDYVQQSLDQLQRRVNGDPFA